MSFVTWPKGRPEAFVVRLDPELEVSLTSIPPPETLERLTDFPIRSVEDVVSNAGLTRELEVSLAALVTDAVNGSKNRFEVHKSLMEAMKLNGDVPAPVRQTIVDRASKLWQHVTAKKGGFEVWEPGQIELLRKAHARGGMYVRRVTKEGKHRYYYDEEKYKQDHGEHLDGQTAKHEYVRERVKKKVTGAGREGLDLKDLTSLVRTHGSQTVYHAIKDCPEVSHKKGRLYAKSSRIVVLGAPEILLKAEQLGLFDQPKKPAPEPTKNLGRWRGLRIIAIGPRGGKIVGYAKGKPIYAGSKESMELASRAQKNPAEPSKPKPKEIKRWSEIDHEGARWVVAAVHKDGTVTLKGAKNAVKRVTRNELLGLPEPAPPPGPIQETPRPISKPTPVERETPGANLVEATPGKIEQVGDHIWGSRKDIIRVGKKIQSSEDLKDLSFDDAAVLVRKAKIANIPSLEEMQKMGMSPGVANLTLALFASITSKPKDSEMARQEYIDSIRGIEGALKNVKTIRDFMGMASEMNSLRQRARDWEVVEPIPAPETPEDIQLHNSAPGKYYRTRGAEKVRELQKDNPGITFNIGYDSRNHQYVVTRKAFKPYDSFGPRFASFIAGSGKIYKETMHQSLSLDNEWSRKDPEHSPARSWAILAAREIDKLSKKPKGAKTKIPTPGETKRGFSQVKSETKIVRAGGSKSFDAADQVRTQTTFGLREIDYGTEGYLPQADREHHTLALEHALHDFSDVLGVPPPVIGLKRRLGIAIGARGRGGIGAAAAHYEPGRKAINITKWKGGGSVAHEWGHAMDNIVAEHFMGKRAGAQQGTSFLSHAPEHSALPDELKNAVGAVMTAILKHPEPEKARAAWRKRYDETNQRVNDLIRRNNEYVREANAITAKPTQESVERRIELSERNIANWTKEAEELRAEIQKKPFKARGRLSFDKREVNALGRDHWIESAKKKIAEWKAPGGVRTEEDQKRYDELQGKVDALRTDINSAKRDLSKIKNTDPEASDLVTASLEEGPYYAAKHELFARSFETYVLERLKADSRRNTYLVSEGRQAAPVYPQGQERKRVVEAFDALMGTMRAGKYLEKAFSGLGAGLIWVTQDSRPREKQLPGN